MLLIGEVKEIAAARYGHRMLIKHVPDQAFAIDNQQYCRVQHRFEVDLTLWGTSNEVRLVTIATFGICATGLPSITLMSLMATNPQWLPVEDVFEQHLIDQLVRTGRSFIKGLRYGLGRNDRLVNATLLDTKDPPVAMMLSSDAGPDTTPSQAVRAGSRSPWVWRMSSGPMPAVPAAATRVDLLR